MDDLHTVKEALFKADASEYGESYQKHALDVYRMYVEMADRISQRRQQANSFYLSVNTALLGLSGFATHSTYIAVSLLLSVSGLMIAIFWIRNIQTYKDLNSAKFAVINLIEEKLVFAPYEAEWKYLKRGTNKSRYHPFHKVEIIVPTVFIAVYVVILFVQLPWSEVMAFFKAVCV